MDRAILERVRELREQGHSPKQIARALGMAPSAVAPLIRAVAEQALADAPEAEPAGCWINVGWSEGLGVPAGAPGWADDLPEGEHTGGMVSVLVARKHGWNKLSVCGYLVDVYCLGVKNTIEPKIMSEIELRRFLPVYYTVYRYGWREAPLDLVRNLVFGAVDYARGLGFEPAADFAKTAGHLGAWDGGSAVTFGKDGKPFYFAGPNDNANRVVRTLERTVGSPPAFDFVIPTQGTSFSMVGPKYDE
jgi:hypothetical protein